MAARPTNEALMRTILRRNQREERKQFEEFCNELLAVPASMELRPHKNFIADTELQPQRWLNLGMDLLQSRKVTGYVQLADGVQGPPLGSYLPYPVFQFAAEVFLKGMWLYQFPDCRGLNASAYIDPPTRKKFHAQLRQLSHDLLRVVDGLRQIPEYTSNGKIARFLELIERVVRVFYFPPYEADRRNRWAECRYPKRVYNDSARVAHAESLQRYPRAEWIETLFRDVQPELERLWR